MLSHSFALPTFPTPLSPPFLPSLPPLARPHRDKRNIVCDGPFKAAFECDTMTIFSMNKYLSKHLLPADSPAC